jgi:hypothetical protein
VRRFGLVHLHRSVDQADVPVVIAHATGVRVRHARRDLSRPARVIRGPELMEGRRDATQRREILRHRGRKRVRFIRGLLVRESRTGVRRTPVVRRFSPGIPTCAFSPDVSTSRRPELTIRLLAVTSRTRSTSTGRRHVRTRRRQPPRLATISAF